jgi:hypothetical protein
MGQNIKQPTWSTKIYKVGTRKIDNDGYLWVLVQVTYGHRKWYLLYGLA